MATKWHYQGDCSLEHGGLFYNLDDMKHGYAVAVEVTPCSSAGAQSNCFWVRHGTVNIPDDLEPSLSYVGFEEVKDGPITDHVKVYAAYSYKGLEVDYSDYNECIQIGGPDPFYGGKEPVTPTKILRASTDLRKWVIREVLRSHQRKW